MLTVIGSLYFIVYHLKEKKQTHTNNITQKMYYILISFAIKIYIYF